MSLPSVLAAQIVAHPMIVLQAHTSPDPAEIQAACERQYPEIDEPVYGCSVTRGRVCMVWITQPGAGNLSDLEIAGHEVWHCLYGTFHD